MVRVLLTEEQARQVKKFSEVVQLCDPQGNVVSTFEPEYSKEFIAELKRRVASPGPRFTGEQVQARLRALQEEWDRTGGFDEAYMHEFLKHLDRSDPGHTRPKGQAG